MLASLFGKPSLRSTRNHTAASYDSLLALMAPTTLLARLKAICRSMYRSTTVTARTRFSTDQNVMCSGQIPTQVPVMGRQHSLVFCFKFCHTP
ncbi:uncharacterized protein F5891DRAFT_1108317, partial [Suillus fuscotomentosus]